MKSYTDKIFIKGVLLQKLAQMAVSKGEAKNQEDYLKKNLDSFQAAIGSNLDDSLPFSEQILIGLQALKRSGFPGVKNPVRMQKSISDEQPHLVQLKLMEILLKMEKSHPY